MTKTATDIQAAICNPKFKPCGPILAKDDEPGIKVMVNLSGPIIRVKPECIEWV